MEQIFVTGHRNPDTDSIVSAMSYAALRNALGERGYTAARLGHLNDESKRILERFSFEPPVLIKDMRTQVLDLDYDTPPALSAALTVGRGWNILRNDANIAAIPVTQEDGTLFGMLSSGDVADYDMQTIENPVVEDIPLFNLLSVLEGRVLNEAGSVADSISGEVIFGLPKSSEQLLFDHENYIAVCGNQPQVIRWALESNIHALILCEAELSPELRELETRTCIITTPFSAFRAARLIFQAIPIARICQSSNLITFRLTDYLDDVRETVSKSRYRCYPILDAENRVVGTLSRYHLLKPRRKKVVLVDHNEAAQSVPGLDQVDILEIIDHHRLADIQTTNPIRVRNEPVGSTNTILAAMYQERGVVPSPKMAGLMAGAILSDTVLFKSPTCTKRDVTMAERLAKIAKVDLEELGKSLFSFGGEAKSAEELFRVDYKQFHIADQNIAVSQITCGSSEELVERKEEFLAFMRDLKGKAQFDIVLLMITDVLLEGTYLLYVGDDEVIRQAFQAEPEGNCIFLPGVMSRKKQIIPMLTALWG